MSNSWISTVYFPVFELWPSDLVLSVMQNLAADGLTFPSAAKGYNEYWTSINDSQIYIVTEQRQALDLSAIHKGGYFKLVDMENRFEMMLGLYCCANKTAPSASAENHFGYITFSVDYANLHDEYPQLIVDRYKCIYRWSTILSRMRGVIYGWGDLTQSLLDVRQAVSAADIQNRAIPRVSRWAYYNKEYLYRVSDKVMAYDAWACYEDDYGLTSFLYPPTQVSHATASEIDWLKAS